MKPFILEEVSEGLLLFTINRPEKRNAINYDVMDGLEKAIDKMNDSSLKALMITGTGDQAFCSGGDLSIFHELKTEKEAYSMLSKMSAILTKLLFLPKPTMALMNGTALGGGCELAAACDFRIARQGIKAGFVQGKLAITTGWGGGTILFEKIPPSNALKLLLDANLLEIEKLVELGFVDAVFQRADIDSGRAFLQEALFLENSIMSAYKEMLIRKWNQAEIKLRIYEEVRACSQLWALDVHHEKVSMFLNGK